MTKFRLQSKMNLIYGNSAIPFEDTKGILSSEWRIAIPSYKRYSTLKEKTLSLLSRHFVDSSKIDIFVADEDELGFYKKVLEKGSYGRIIVGIKGMMNIRNFIQSFYDEGQRIVCLDDDISDIMMIRNNGDKKYSNLQNLNLFFDYCFSICDELRTKYWGIYAASNPFFMSRTIAYGLYYLIGSCWGMVVSHSRDLYVTMDDKEDFERSVRAYLKFGNVVRMNFVTVKSSYYTEDGGMQVERTEERVESSGRKLIAMFPHCVHINNARKKHFEVKLFDKKNNHNKMIDLM